MTTLQASEFKAKCLSLMDKVAETGETIVITKNGKPIAELRAHRAPRAASPFGLHAGASTILGDVVEPRKPGGADSERREAFRRFTPPVGYWPAPFRIHESVTRS